MVRILLALLCSVMLVVAGCARDNFFQRRRDKFLLNNQRITKPAFAPPHDFAPEAIAPGTNPPVMPVFVDRSRNREVTLSLREALIIALRHSEIVRVSEGTSVTANPNTFYDLEVSQANVKAALAAFDAALEANFYTTTVRKPPNAFFGPGLAQPSVRDQAALSFGISKPFITGGSGSIFYNPDPGYLFIPDSTGSSFNPTHVGELEFSITQPLLRGAGIAVNRAPIEIGQASAEQSAWQFKKAVMESVRSVIVAYWDLYAAHVALKSFNEVIPQLEELVRLQEQGYKAEWVIYADVAKAYAQLHLYRQQRLELESEIVAQELRLRNLLGLPPADGWNLIPTTEPTDRLVVVDQEDALRLALANHPDLVRQRLEVRIRELELLVAENNRLPKLDFRALYRMNGVGADLGSTLQQLATAEYADWLLGATFAIPVGRRQATAEARAAQLKLARQNGLLRQQMLSITHELGNDLRRLDFAYREYREADQRLRAANDWLKGARLRYENPSPDAGDGNWLLANLNDYLAALRFRTDAATDAAAVLARYNNELVRLEETKGTILSFFAIDFAYDPCLQSRCLEPLSGSPVRVRPIPIELSPVEQPHDLPSPAQLPPRLELLPPALPTSPDPD